MLNSRNANKEILKILKESYPSLYDVYEGGKITSSVNENTDGAEMISSLQELESFIKGKELPYIQNTKALKKGSFRGRGLLLTVGVIPKNANSDAEGQSFGVEMFVRDEDDIMVSFKSGMIKSGIESKDFYGNFIKNDSSEFNSFYDIVDRCDYNKFYRNLRDKAIDLVALRLEEVAYMFKHVESKFLSGEDDTLWVTYDKIRGVFMLGYNPRFILAATLEEFASKRNKFESLKECYIYTLGFLIAHEMQHLLRHNTSSKIGEGISESIHPKIDNLIFDSFINISLGQVFRGLVKDDFNNDYLDNGIGIDIVLRSSADDGGFKLFKSSKDILTKLSVPMQKFVGGVNLKLDTSASLDASLLQSLAGGFVLLKLSADPNDVGIRSGSLQYARLLNSVIRVLIDGNVKSANEGMSESENEAATQDSSKGAGALLGNKVKDKSTGRYGVVVVDDENGVQVAFPDDQTKIDDFVKEVKEKGSGYARESVNGGEQ